MKCTVYRSLDKPVVFLGLSGTFIRWFLVFLAGILVLSFVVGTMFTSIVGIVFFIGGVGLDYVFVLSLQGKSSDRSMQVRMASRKIASCIVVPAMAFRHVWRGDRFGV